MADYGLLPEFSPSAHRARPSGRGRRPTPGCRCRRAAPATAAVRDLRHLLWCSIDNDDSLDLDQLSVSEPQAGGATRILVAIADVDALVPQDSAIDQHARQNTTSVYTPAEIFPMLPERLSTDLTSLAFGRNGARVVVDLDRGRRRLDRRSGRLPRAGA